MREGASTHPALSGALGEGAFEGVGGGEPDTLPEPAKRGKKLLLGKKKKRRIGIRRDTGGSQAVTISKKKNSKKWKLCSKARKGSRLGNAPTLAGKQAVLAKSRFGASFARVLGVVSQR